MRLGRAAFWGFAVLNILAAAALVALLPAGLALPRLGSSTFPLEELPFKPLIAYLACLPLVWLGARRLHDVGQSGIHAWMPLLAFAGWTIGTTLLQPLLLALMMATQNPVVMNLVPALFVALWAGGLLLAAGTVRTVFLWLQPGEAKDNRYGPALGPPPAAPSPVRPGQLLGGRMARLPFWLLVAANAAVVRGPAWLFAQLDASARASLTIAFGDFIAPFQSPYISVVVVLLYLPAQAASVLRLHDRGQSGWIAGFVLVVNLAAAWAQRGMHEPGISVMNFVVNLGTMYLLYQCLQPGDAGANRYGPPPGDLENGLDLPEPDPAPAPAVRSAAPDTYRAPAKPRFGRRSAS